MIEADKKSENLHLKSKVGSNNIFFKFRYSEKATAF